MASMKQYFTFKMRTKCGIPYIELAGTKQDWITLSTKADLLFRDILPEYAALLRPISSKFIAAFDGDWDLKFWKGMCKRVEAGRGSGAHDTISGWVSTFYLYLTGGKKNTKLKRWQDMVGGDGPDPEDFPRILSSAPVKWECLGRTYPLHFHAGVLGVKQDPDTKALSTVTAWFVTHDPSVLEANTTTGAAKDEDL